MNHGKGSKGESIKWATTNEPFNSNLDVFEINYKDISPASVNDQDKQIQIIIEKVSKMFKDFGLKTIPDKEEILYKLNPLKVKL
ncbi:hypothetical protein GE118_00500 [Mycoplasma sp. NEAQ87857]|uniref:hypothetical protein n=1 Tax=Mycoplasma sp. NEAQ87857 TaxID=2683967 RepID=UPI00131916A5|nr:hypothetical protein [Mycoplasma sp. NEAQ87857]QGZ97284.1 hypothetical protein GE118_00500 [Mycoplasma sp. NEAQ87857]